VWKGNRKDAGEGKARQEKIHLLDLRKSRGRGGKDGSK